MDHKQTAPLIADKLKILPLFRNASVVALVLVVIASLLSKGKFHGEESLSDFFSSTMPEILEEDREVLKNILGIFNIDFRNIEISEDSEGGLKITNSAPPGIQYKKPMSLAQEKDLVERLKDFKKISIVRNRRVLGVKINETFPGIKLDSKAMYKVETTERISIGHNPEDTKLGREIRVEQPNGDLIAIITFSCSIVGSNGKFVISPIGDGDGVRELGKGKVRTFEVNAALASRFFESVSSTMGLNVEG